MNLPDDFAQSISRRTFLKQSAFGLGSIALGTLMGVPAQAGVTPSPVHPLTPSGKWRGVITTPHHFPVRAKRIIHLCMAGGPSHIDTFDPKPMLTKMHGQPFPESL